MSRFSGGFHVMRLVIVSMLLSASLTAASSAGTFPTKCLRDISPVLDSWSYSLYVTVPTTGYHFKLVRARVKGDIVNVSLHWSLDPGLHGQVVLTHRVRFALLAPHFASRYTVTFNGRRAGRVKAIGGIESAQQVL